MTFRVVNVSTGEIVAEFGPQQFDFAAQLADKLAEDVQHREQIVVVQLVTVYETSIDQGQKP
jgi:hypothetical protein